MVSEVLVITGIWVAEQYEICVFIVQMNFICLLKLAALECVKCAIQALVGYTYADLSRLRGGKDRVLGRARAPSKLQRRGNYHTIDLTIIMRVNPELFT